MTDLERVWGNFTTEQVFRSDPGTMIRTSLHWLSAFAFGGISLLIAVGVALEFMRQIDSQLMMSNYEGFLKPTRSGVGR